MGEINGDLVGAEEELVGDAKKEHGGVPEELPPSTPGESTR